MVDSGHHQSLQILIRQRLAQTGGQAGGVDPLTTDNPEDHALIELVLSLPVKYRSVVHLYYYEDYPIREISEILEISESAVKMRLKRGRQLLKLELEGEEL